MKRWSACPDKFWLPVRLEQAVVRWWRPCCIDALNSLRPSHIFIENAKKELNLEGIGTCQ
jgi:hypothetical protein